MKYFLSLFLVLSLFLGLSCEAGGESLSSWNRDFQNQLQEAVAMRRKSEPLANGTLYSLGRAYIRKKYEDCLVIIEKKGLKADSETLLLKQVYKFFNYCNPLGLELAQGMPKFDAPVRSNNILLKRWQGLYGQASGDATVMFDYGDKMYGPQIYELGRALFLYKLHSPAPGPEDQEFSREQWNVLRAVFHIISNLNSPGGPNLSYAPDFAPNTRPRKRKATRWAEVERTLRDNLDGLGMGSGLISFLVGSPSAWTATSAKLGKKPSREAIIALAAHANSVLAKAAGASIRTSRTRRPRRQVRRAFSPISSTATLTPRFCRRPSASVFSVPPIRRANSRRSVWPGV